MKLVSACLTFLFSMALVVGLVVLNSWIGALVLRDLWSWFVVPLWPMMWELQLPEALGINLVVGYITHQTYPGPSKKDVTGKASHEWLHVFQISVAVPASFWTVGYIVHKIWGA